MASLIGGIVSLVFVFIGLTVVIPNVGAFGVLWTGAALAGTIVSFYNAFSDRGIASEIVDIDDDSKSDAPWKAESEIETRLRKLDDLKSKGLITQDEYSQRRNAILGEI